MPIIVKLFLGEQDGLSFQARNTPEILWIMSYEARDIIKKSKDLGIDLSEDEPLHRLPYRLDSTFDDDGQKFAFYCYDESVLFPEEQQDVVPGEDQAQ